MTWSPRSSARTTSSGDHPGDARLAFTLKEAAYKAWSADGGPVLGFDDMRVTAASERFVATVDASQWSIRGRYTVTEGRWLALAVGYADC